jgi:hypothetical protein
MNLVKFEEASRRLRAAARSYRGIRQIPLDKIVGSVDRSDEFDRSFHVRSALSRHRLDALRTASVDVVLPPIDVFEIGGAYFVEDGHHRVALAREQGAEFIDAEVTSLLTDYEVDPEVDVCRLMHTEQHQRLLEDTGLAKARPDADIRFTLLDGYTQLRDVIDAYGYRLSRERGALLSPEEIAGRWYDTEYLPGLETIRRADLPRRYESWRSTEGDLFLWVYQLRRDLRANDDKIDFEAAAQHARGIHLGYMRKRHHLREGRTPLPRRTSASES